MASTISIFSLGGLSQVIIFLMMWCVLMGVSMLSVHLVAQVDPNRSVIIIIGLAISWIALSNVSAVIIILADRFLVLGDQARISEGLLQIQFLLGGVFGGWLALCITCYRPPGVMADKIHGFICRTMLTSAIGLTVLILLLVRVVVPYSQGIFY